MGSWEGDPLLYLLRVPLWEGEGGHGANTDPKRNDLEKEGAFSLFRRRRDHRKQGHQDGG